MVRLKVGPCAPVHREGRAPSGHLTVCNTDVIMDWLDMGPMADWLCRLSPEEWALTQWSAEAAKALGVDAWVISVEAEGVAPQQAELLGEMLESPDGLPVALEWCLSEHSGLASLQQKLDGIGPWLQHPRAYRIAGRSLLLIRGTEHLRSEPSVAERLHQLFLSLIHI